MIHFAVVARQGAPAPQGLGASFGPEGGTIGRAAGNTLVLDDPDRTVSRVHAQVLLRDGRYFIVDRGSNPLHCNGAPLGAGNEAPLQGGERLVIGSFELVVTVEAGAPASAATPAAARQALPPVPLGGVDGDANNDPFADLLAGLSATPSPAAPARQAPEVPSADAGRGLPFSDPLGPAEAPGMRGAALAHDPFADLLGPAPAVATPGSALPSDDFSDLGLPAAAHSTANAQRIDDLFGGAQGAGMGGDPLALSPLADPLLQPNTASRDDPLAAFGNAAAPLQAARSDHLPIGQFGFTPPRELPAHPPAAPAAPTSPAASVPLPGAAALAASDDEGVRFDDETGQPIRIARTPAARPAAPVAAPTAPVVPTAPAMPAVPASPAVIDPFDDLMGGLSPASASSLDDLLTGMQATPAAGPPPATAAVSAPPMPAQLPAALPEPVSPPVAAPAFAPLQSAAAPGAPLAGGAPAASAVAKAAVATDAAGVQAAAAGGELLAAFLRGLGPVHQVPTTLTPALMERIGSLLRASTEGTLQLLLTRQELKREVRAEVTMIAAQANNPLKFSPTADVALAHLLGPGIRGFMPAEAAMRDAYDDLRAHQFGVMVGMRAALERLIARFEPQELEKKIAARSALDSLFAANRKAKLWDQFTALYGTIASEAEDDFHTLFGKAFLEAYEEQMARLKSDGRPAP
ncbi:MAG: type VI secretion system-associated FHA domain protein TagH [Comamonadaceae bacterium]|nr:MAG: type VI secretion system-associated FHA domain protein TagH [Comamonadaceae bacterium]